MTRKWYLVGFFITFIIGFLLLFQKPQKMTPQLSLLEYKHYPNDHFFLQKAFPDAAIDMNAYSKALNIAKNTASDRNNFKNFDRKWIVEGPGNLGARVNAIAVHPQNENIIFAGFSGGGVFRTLDGGANWQPVFDEQLFLAIGDIVFDPIDNNIIYVGTGDPNISGFPFLGDGLYKSTDLGANWTYLGLEKQRIISKILVHPFNNQILYAATMGLPFERNVHKGLYKSADGGQSWRQVLFLGGQTGIIDVIFDARDPEILYAAGWDRVRNNQESTTFGTGAKIYKTINGGTSWNQLSGGLPMDEQSRIGLATASDGILAVYTDTLHQFQGLYKSANQGLSWQALPVNAETNGFDPNLFGGFGWYFSKVRVNPNNDADISVLGVRAFRTQNGGQQWASMTKKAGIYVHPDIHDLVFTPSGDMIIATDGGLYRSTDNGIKWKDIENIPASQVYRVAYNPHKPENYYAGMQDNGTASGNVHQRDNWKKIYGGDGFQMVFHPTEPQVFYTEYQRGGILVTLDGGANWENGREGIDLNDRRNWNMPYFISPHNQDVLYTGTHRVYKSEVGAIPFWEPISEDLTNGEGAGNLRQTISAICQSPVNPALLYVGTTDANVWRSNTEGTSWEKLSGLPQRYVTEIVASPDISENVYVTFSGYKDNDNTAHIFKSTNRGITWTSIANDLPPLAINALKIMEGTNDQVIFLATDGGVYGTLDGGSHWERLGANMPIVAVYDLEWNLGQNTLVAGTFARSVLSYSLEGIVEPPENTLSSVNFQKEEQQGLIIYPNPVVHNLNLQFVNEKPNHAVTISIFDINGQLMQTAKRTTGKEVTWEVNLNNLPSGIYLLRIQGTNFGFNGQFVKI